MGHVLQNLVDIGERNLTCPVKHVETTEVSKCIAEAHWKKPQKKPPHPSFPPSSTVLPLMRPWIPSAPREFVGAQHRCHGPLGPRSIAADLYAHPPCARAKSPQPTPARGPQKARAIMRNCPQALHKSVNFMGKMMVNQCKSNVNHGIWGVGNFSEKAIFRWWESMRSCGLPLSNLKKNWGHLGTWRPWDVATISHTRKYSHSVHLQGCSLPVSYLHMHYLRLLHDSCHVFRGYSSPQ